MIKLWHYQHAVPVQSPDFSVNGYGIREPMPTGIVDRPQGTGDFLIMYFFDPVDIAVGGVVRRQESGTLMMWRPGSHQYYGNPGAGYDHSWLHCAGTLPARHLTACALPLDTPVRGVDGERFEHYLHSIHGECGRSVVPDRRIVENVFRNLTFEIQRALQPSRSGVSEVLIEVRDYLEAHLAQHATLTQLARMANLSPQHFCLSYRRAFGVSPISHLLQMRLAQAAYLLLDRNARVGEVARTVGIEDVYYFSKAFKRRYGVSPRRHRERPGSAGGSTPQGR